MKNLFFSSPNKVSTNNNSVDFLKNNRNERVFQKNKFIFLNNDFGSNEIIFQDSGDLKNNLTNQVLSASGIFSAEEINWHLHQINEGKTDEEKINFYLWAAKKRNEILAVVPKDKKEGVKGTIKKLLDQHTGADRGEIKGKALEEMYAAITQFQENQRLVRDKTQKLRHLPPGFEKKIWERFINRFNSLTSGDILDPKLMGQFSQSVETTFLHLTKVLEQQEAIRKKFSNKYFHLRSEDGMKSERERLSEILQTQIFDWLDQKLSLRNLSQRLENILKKQLPQNIGAFKEHYSQVFSPEFWKISKSFNPMELPSFSGVFRFQTETDFLARLSLQDIKNFPPVIKPAIINDANSMMSEYFGPDEKQKITADFKKIPETKPNQLLKKIQFIQKKSNQNRITAQKKFKEVKGLYLLRDTENAMSGLTNLKKKYGENIFSALGEKGLENLILTRYMRLRELEKKLKGDLSPKRRIHIQKQLLEITFQSQKLENSLSGEEKKLKIKQIEDEVKALRKAGNYRLAKTKAKQLRGLNDTRAELLISEINRQIENDEGDDHNEKQEEKVDSSLEKKKKIEFLEKCIEHAEKVIDTCAEIGMPDDDETVWGNEGIKKRAQWLKDNGYHDIYQKLHAQDPNIPSTEQAGFRFRWLDSRGERLNGTRAEQGLIFLRRFKESGYILATLAGGFSIDWQGPNSKTYTPKKFKDAVLIDLNKLKTSKI